MIHRFGSLRSIHSASGEALAEALSDLGERAGAIASAIVAARRFSELAAREAFVGDPIDGARGAFHHYLFRRLGTRREECVLIFYFTEEGFFIAEDLYVGARRTGSVIPLRRTVRRAVDLDARRVLLAHNHPSGLAAPSSADIASTSRLRNVVEALAIALEDHCIVAGEKVASMRAMRLL